MATEAPVICNHHGPGGVTPDPSVTFNKRARDMRRILPLLTLFSLLLVACGGSADVAGDGTTGDQPLSEQTSAATDGQGIGEGEPDPNAGGAAAGSCLAGDTNCTDESYDGQDVARPVALSDALPEAAAEIERGESNGATGHAIEAVIADGDTLGIAFSGGACDVLQDVLVTESDTEVRILVLAGVEASVETCTMQIVAWSTEITLDTPLGDRTILDLAG